MLLLGHRLGLYGPAGGQLYLLGARDPGWERDIGWERASRGPVGRSEVAAFQLH